MQFTQESKSQLAKLMATENLTVEHRKVATASFNLKDRVLTLPIWKDMSGDMYDLLTGHEVGHALETPEEGWHNAVMGTGKFNGSFKNFLNVVEDCRIEKKIKRRFPGLRQSFTKAYSELLERDFFGIKFRDVNALPFIDRLNLYTKGGVSLGIQFTREEEKMLADVESCETWDDVVRVTEAVYNYSKNEQKEIQESKLRPLSAMKMDDDGDDEYDMDETTDSSDDYIDEDDNGEPQVASGDGDDESSDGEENKTEGKSPSNEDGEEESEKKDGEEIQRDKLSQNSNSGGEEFDPVCETDETFRANESKLLSRDSKEYLYVTIPTPNLAEIVTPYKRVHELMEEHWKQYVLGGDFDAKRKQAFTEFKNRNDRYVSLLAKEFEMRKAASKFSKQRVAETGDIDVSRIYKYQVDDNIFRKATFVPKGKSHGLVLLLDRSGSMSSNMQSSWEQILVLAMFCQKVNIPFVVYGFGNDEHGFGMDFNRPPKYSFSEKEMELKGSDVFLREYLNSRMGSGEFNRCMKNLVCLADSYGYRHSRQFSTPKSEGLSNTPMTEAMIALKDITNQFRKVNNLDIVNTVIMHDGDADAVRTVNSTRTDYRGREFQGLMSFSTESYNVVLRDKKNNFEELMVEHNDCPVRESVFNWYRKATGSKIIGFFIAGTGNSLRAGIERRYVNGEGKSIRDIYPGHSNNDYFLRKEASKTYAQVMKTERFLESKNYGYNKFFIIPGGEDLEIENEGLQIQGAVTAGKLKNAFMKMNKKKQVSRVLVNRFIGEIAV